MLLPEIPAAVGSGGQVRAYHFLKAAAEHYDVIACLLVELKPTEPMPNILEAKQVLQAPAVDRETRTGSSTLNRVAISLFGWARHHGRQLMLAGAGVCVERQNSLTMMHHMYGLLMLGQARIARMFCKLYSSDVHVRGRAWDMVKPQIVDAKPGPGDVVWCEHSYLYPLAVELKQISPDVRTVVNCHNVEWLLKRSIAETMSTRLAKRWMLLESKIAKDWERAMVRNADLLFSCSPIDATHLERLSSRDKEPIVPIANGVDTDYFVPAPSSEAEPLILFTGTAGYAPNDDAVHWLVQEIYPAIKQHLPNCKLLLAGRNARQKWGKFASQFEQIEVVSDVPDMRPLLRRAWVCVVPLRSGSGTRLKIVEAMSSGRAIVSTSIGAEGLEVESGKHLIIADSVEPFAAAVCGLLKDPLSRSAYEQRGREIAVAKYEWSGLSARIRLTVDPCKLSSL